MSQAPSNNSNQQAKAQAQQQQQQKNEQQAKEFEKASTPTGNTGSGYGGGRVTYNSQGGRLVDNNLIVSNTQANRTILEKTGVKGESQGQSLLVNYGDLEQARSSSGFASTSQDLSKPVTFPAQEKSFGFNFVDSKLGTKQLERGSASEAEKEKSEADRASKIYGTFSNSDFATGGKKSSDKTVVSLGKAESVFGKTSDDQFGWHDVGKDQLVRGSKQEQKVEQSQAEKAFTESPSKANSSYVTGGTPDKTFGGPTTPQSKGSSAGWSVLAPDQISRNSGKESQAKSSEASRVAVAFPSSTKPEFTPLFGLVDKNAEKENQSIYKYVSSGKAEQENALGNGLISLSNKQVASKNVKSENEFKSFLNQGEKQDATFSFFSGNKKVGESSGPRTYYDFLKAREKYGDNLSISESFSGREKELTNAVQKNTAFYSSLPQSYWDALSKSGYISENNAGKINDILNLNAKIQNRESLANVYGFASDVIATKYQNNPITGITPYKQEYNRDLITGKLSDINSENEIVTFGNLPFSRTIDKSINVKNNFASSSSNVPQVSGADIILTLGPELGSKEIDLASRGLEKLVFEKAGPKLAGVKTEIGNKVRTNLQQSALEERQSKFVKPPEVNIRPTNMKELEFVGGQISKQTMGRRPETETETSLRNSPKVKENPEYTPSTNVFNPKPQPNFDINFKTETPVYRKTEYTSKALSPEDIAILGRYPKSSQPFTEPTLKSERSAPSSSSKSLLKNKGPLPFQAITEPNSQVSPISRSFEGTQFQGNPANFAETQPLFSTAWESKTSSYPQPIPLDITYNPGARSSLEYSRYNKLDINAILGSSITPKEETTDVGLFNLLKTSVEKAKPKQNEVLHGTDFLSALNIKEKGAKISLKKGQGFHVTEDPFLALAFADLRTAGSTQGKGVFVKYDTLTDLLSRATGGRKYLKAEQVPQITKKQFSAVEGSDIIAHPLTGEPMKEILVTKKDFLVGEPKIIDVSDILAIKNIKPRAAGISPLESTYPTNEVGTLRYGETLERRENIEIFKVTKNQVKEPKVYFNPSGGNKVPSPLETGERNYPDFRTRRFESSKKEESIFDILSQTLSSKGEKLQNYPQLPEKPEDLIQSKAVKGGQYGGKSPIDIYSSSSGFSENPKDTREFLGLAGEKVSGKSSGKLPLEKYNLVAEGGLKEGDIVGINPRSGTYLRKYSDISILKFGPKTGSGPLDIQTGISFGGTESRGFIEGKGIFTNAKGAKYYTSEPVYQYGSSFIRGSLQTKDVGLAKFAKYQKEHPQPEKIGDVRFDSFVSKLPKGNKKSPVFNNLLKQSEKGKTFKSSSAKLFEEKKVEPKKGTEFKNIGSKQETVLLQKPLQKRRIISSQEQQYESNYEFRPIPESKSESSLSSLIGSGLKSGTLSGLMSGSKLGSMSLLGNLNKNLTGIKPKSSNRQSPKQTGILFIGQEEKLSPKQSLRFFQSPKQNTSPKQAQKQTPKIPTPQTPRSSLIPKQSQPPFFQTPTKTKEKPPKLPPPSLLFGPTGRKRGGKSKSGPTAIENLNVNNIFASSLSIKVGKNRVEF